MPRKRKGAAAKDKSEAPAANTTKGNWENKSKETPIVSPDRGADGETATLVQLAEVDETPKNFKTTDRDGKLKLTLLIGAKVTMPITTIDNYDTWYEFVGSCDYGNIPIFELTPDEYEQIMEECHLGVDSEDEEVVEKDGVVHLEDYIAEIQKKDKEWAKRYSIRYL